MAPITNKSSKSSNKKQKHPKRSSHDIDKSKQQTAKRAQCQKSRCDPNSLPPLFRRYIQAESTTFTPFVHNPRFASSSVALEAALDFRENDVLEHGGDSVHNVSAAKVLYDHFFVNPVSEEEEVEVAYDIQKRYAAFEYSVILYTQNSIIGTIQCKMDGDPLPESGDDLKLYANDFEAHTCYIKKTYVEERLLDFYKGLIIPSMPSVKASFDEVYATQPNSNSSLGRIHTFRTRNYAKVNPAHEEALMCFLEDNDNQPIRDSLLGLTTPEQQNLPIKFDKRHRVIDDCRPLDFLGYLLWKEALGFQAELLYTWHHAHQAGGAKYRSQLCWLAASKGAVTFLSTLAGFKDGHEDENTDRLPSRFYVAIGKLWKSDKAKLEAILEFVALQTLLYSAQVLFDHGVSLPFYNPKKRVHA
ncbi:hypothetical protein ONZ45_g7407 [Pleurotus djamor]|nr:hypothetical protein ONZ45_g7407 [Pleurotus djamor]